MPAHAMRNDSRPACSCARRKKRVLAPHFHPGIDRDDDLRTDGNHPIIAEFADRNPQPMCLLTSLWVDCRQQTSRIKATEFTGPQT